MCITLHLYKLSLRSLAIKGSGKTLVGILLVLMVCMSLISSELQYVNILTEVKVARCRLLVKGDVRVILWLSLAIQQLLDILIIINLISGVFVIITDLHTSVAEFPFDVCYYRHQISSRQLEKMNTFGHGHKQF